MSITGNATAAGTATYAKRHSPLNYQLLGTTNCVVSEVGFGSYRVNSGNGTHEQALRFALQSGINLIDTSSNYADGGSERLIGRVLLELIEAGELARDQVFIVSKVGYLQGYNYALAEQRKEEGRPFPNLIKYAEGLDHCIHPEFIEDQLSRSLERLNLETIDGYLLHNPEYYLMWAKKAHYVREDAWIEYYRRIREAFEYLEQAVSDGRIQWYGISSNSFPEPAEHFTHTSLAKVWQIAHSISRNHHFRLVQTPMNLLETEAATVKNQPDGETFLQFANSKNLGVLINRPLNAFKNNSLTRLSQIDMPNYPAPAEDVSTAVDTLIQQELNFKQNVLPQLAVETEKEKLLTECLAIGQMLDGRWGGFGTYQNWRDLQKQFLLPRAQTAVEFLSNLENLPSEVSLWLDQYIEAANIMFAAVSAYYQEQAAKQCQQITETVQSINDNWHATTLSQTAVRALRTTTGIHCVLVGMRHQDYVSDMLAELVRPGEKETTNDAWLTLAAKM